MVNMPFTEQAVKLAKENDISDKIGLHLNLTEGFPLSKDIGNSALFCNEYGMFNSMVRRKSLSRLHISNSIKSAVIKEAEAQIQKYISFGFSLMHFDSHHHIHTELSIVNLLYPLFSKYCFKSVRISRNLANISILKTIYKKHYNYRIKKSGINSSDWFGDINDFRSFSDYINNDETVEIMVHPRFEPKTGIIVDFSMSMEELHEYLLCYKKA
jgi:predicted glycoside hydrolase/deacetylase ChbG (UPF0249 family)